MQNALELWARISAGQIQEILVPFLNMPIEVAEDIRILSRQIEAKIQENLSPTPSSKHGIVSKDKDLSWEMYQTIRHRLAWDKASNPPERDWNTMWAVKYDEPQKITEIPLLTIVKL
jgi:hypothetical protein